MYTIIVYSQKTMFADLLVKEIKEYFILNEFNIKKEISFSVYSDIIQLEQIENKTDTILIFDCCKQKELEVLYTKLKEKWNANNILLINEFNYPDNESGYKIIKNTEELFEGIKNVLYPDKMKVNINAQPEILLTNREQEILVLIAQGKLNKEIADELNITERTVKNHISNMFKKLDVYDRTQAAVYAIKNKLYQV